MNVVLFGVLRECLRWKSYAFRPGVIRPMHGATSKTASYRILYTITKPVLRLLRWMFPSYILTTEQIGRAMLGVARRGKFLDREIWYVP